MELPYVSLHLHICELVGHNRQSYERVSVDNKDVAHRSNTFLKMLIGGTNHMASKQG